MMEPSQQNRNNFLECVREQSQKFSEDPEYKEQIGEASKIILHGYIQSGSIEQYKAFSEMDLVISDSQIENRVIEQIKKFIKGPSKKRIVAIKLLLSKGSNSLRIEKNILLRIIKKPFRKIYSIFQIESIQANLVSLSLYKKFGYTKNTISIWNRMKKNDKENYPEAEPERMKWAHKHGFLYGRIEQYGLDETNLGNFVSDLDYILLKPINNSYTKWIEDIASLRYIFVPYKKYFPKYYFHIIERDGNRLFIKMPDCPEIYHGNDPEEVIQLLREKGVLSFRPAQCATGSTIYKFSYKDERFYIGENEVSENYIRNILVTRKRFYVVQEYIEMDSTIIVDNCKINELRAVVVNDKIFNPKITELYLCLNDGRMIQVDVETGEFSTGNIKNWKTLKGQLFEIISFVPQLEYYAIYFKIFCDKIYVQSFNPHPALLKAEMPSQERVSFLQKKLSKKRAEKRNIFSVQRVKRFMWKQYKRFFCKPGYRDFMLKEYIKGISNDFLHFKKTTIRQKLWCYKRGYYSFRIDQYGLTENNWEDFLSDRDYHWLCPINNVYQKWIDDKTTYRYVIEPFRNISPKYYYHIINRDGEQYAIKMIDCPEQYSSTLEGIMDLLKDEGALAVKQSAGEHGDGFFKLAYTDGKYFINHDEVTYDTVIKKLKGLTCFYNVTEFLTMHESLRHIYPGSVNTVRVMVLNPTGCDPFIADAYMRIGTGSTKMTDNIGYGGVFAKVDVDTGRYYDAEQLQDHVIVPCPYHPDTNVYIEGYLPEWEKVKKYLIDICSYFGQLEYLGFDVALSDEGVRILEINKYQDLHRCAFYSDVVQEFFKEKIQSKKRRFNLK